MHELTIEAKKENLDKVLSFVEETLEAHDAPMKSRMQIAIAVEELFVNIAYYAYGEETGMATIQTEVREMPLSIEIGLIDNGIPYNPLERPDPDVTLSAAERQAGGLGIYMVKQIMDDVWYEYRNKQNVLRIRKNL